MNDHTLDPPLLDLVVRTSPTGQAASGTKQVVWATHDGGRVVVKSGTGRTRSGLRREAETLGRIDVAGLVEVHSLIDDDATTALVLVDAGHRTLDAPGTASSEQLLRALLHASQIVADLHERGWTHGNLGPEHVIVGPRGRVRLCSLGSARTIVGDPDGRRADCTALLDIVDGVASSLAAREDSASIARPLERLVRDLRGGPSPLEATQIAARLRTLTRGEHAGSGAPFLGLAERFAAIPGVRRRCAARFSRWSQGRPWSRRTQRPAGLVGAVAAVALVVGAAIVVVSAPTPDIVGAERIERPTNPQPIVTVGGSGGPASTAAKEDDMPPPTVRFGGSTYRVGLSGDVVSIGDWDCDGVDTVRLLRPATGELFEFDQPAGRTTVDGRIVTHVEGATDLEVRPADPSASPCDRLVVVRDDGTEEVLR